MAAALYAPHSPGLAATYADVENHALSAGEALAGTPGSLSVRKNANGTQYYVRQYYDYDGRKRDQYLGGSPADPADPTSADWRRRIEEAKELQVSIRLLIREGYSALPPKHLAAIMPLTNHGIFEAGAVLIGTHAFDVIVNRLGIRAATFATEDIDIASPGKLALERMPKGGFLEMLNESGIDFVAASQRPFLGYLLGETQIGAAISRHGAAAVRVPVPERFALHKLLVARLRTGRSTKSQKDLRQASVLIAALGERFPGAIEAAYAKLPASARAHVRKSVEEIRDALEPHGQSWEELARLAKV